MATRSACDWVDLVIAAARTGATKLPLLQRRPLPGPFAWTNGGPIPPSLARWLAYDAAWFARARAPFPSLAAGVLPTAPLAYWIAEALWGTEEAKTFTPPAELAAMPALRLRHDIRGSVMELLLADPALGPEPPVLALRRRRDPFGDELTGVSLGLAFPSFGVWLATRAGLITQSRSPVMIEVDREIEADALEQLLAGSPSAPPLVPAPPLPVKPARIPLEPGVPIAKGFKELLDEATEGDDPARIVELCQSPKGKKSSRGGALNATIEGYEDAAIALLDFDPLATKAFFNAAMNGRLKVLRACLDRGMDVDAKDDGKTPLSIARQHAQAAAAAMLEAHAEARPGHR